MENKITQGQLSVHEIGGETEEGEENRIEPESYHFCIRAGKQAGSPLRI